MENAANSSIINLGDQITFDEDALPLVNVRNEPTVIMNTTQDILANEAPALAPPSPATFDWREMVRASIRAHDGARDGLSFQVVATLEYARAFGFHRLKDLVAFVETSPEFTEGQHYQFALVEGRRRMVMIGNGPIFLIQRKAPEEVCNYITIYTRLAFRVEEAYIRRWNQQNVGAAEAASIFSPEVI